MNRTTKFACSVAALLTLMVIVSTYADGRKTSNAAKASEKKVPVINVRLEVATTLAGGKPISILKPVLSVFDSQVATIQLKQDNGELVELNFNATSDSKRWNLNIDC